MKLLLLAAAWAAGPCPTIGALKRPWLEHAGPIPPEALQSHLAEPPRFAYPVLAQAGAEYHWFGGSRRGPEPGEGPGCQALGSLAFYYNGPELAPERDVVRTVASGQEAGLWPALVELRWFDPKDGRKHRWVHRDFLSRRGWADSPVPAPGAVNSLD